jgi:hypothetical protein
VRKRGRGEQGEESRERGAGRERRGEGRGEMGKEKVEGSRKGRKPQRKNTIQRKS